MFDQLPDFALSIRQPWAWAILHAGKHVENRDWATGFRGPVCIHAAKGMTNHEWNEATYFMHSHLGLTPPMRISMERGGIVGVAEMVDCVDRSDSPWFFGRYGFVLRNIRPVEFIPCRGELKFFRWKPAAVANA
jgi:hypothetical protein